MTSNHAFEDKGKLTSKSKQKGKESAKEKDKGSLSTNKLPGSPLDTTTVQHLQHTMGNAAVQRFLAQRRASDISEIDDDTANLINQKRGKGGKLDENIANQAGQTMGQDFGEVNVHTDAQSDVLASQLGAKAFTTGNDIFFKQGEYNPASGEGQHLIAHELTHVVQQGASTPSLQSKMSVNDPNDQYEAEADKVADMVMAQPEGVQLQEEEEEAVQMQEEEEETVQMQEEDEEMLEG